MKKNLTRTFVSALMLTSLSFSTAFAADICTDPLQKICKETEGQRLLRETLA